MSDLIDRERAWKLQKEKRQRSKFPLCVHSSGRRFKNLLKRPHYFGPVADDIPGTAQAALNLWLEQRDDLLAGQAGGLEIRHLCSACLVGKDTQLSLVALGDEVQRIRTVFRCPRAMPTDCAEWPGLLASWVYERHDV